MAEPVTLRAAMDSFHKWLRARGIDPDAPLPETDQLDQAEQTRHAITYTDQHTPARFTGAIADNPDITQWADQVIARARADSAANVSVFVRRGPSILILGPTGVGKTHQAYGAMRRIAEAGVRTRWIALTAADLYARLRPRHGIDSETEFRAIADAPLLMVDDLGAAKTSEWVEEVNYRLINWRYDRVLPTVFTSNVLPKELKVALGERVASRLVEMADRVTLKGEDRRRTP